MVTYHLCWDRDWRTISAMRYSLGFWRRRRKRIRRRRFSCGAACFRTRRSPGRTSDFCGSTAVLVGRLYLWGLAVAGEEGVREVLLNLLADLDLTMALSGYACCHELDAATLCKSDSSELLRQPQLYFVHRQVAAPIRRCHNSISNAGLWSGTCVSRHQALRGLYGTAR